MISFPRLLTDLQCEFTRLHTDFRARCDAAPKFAARREAHRLFETRLSPPFVPAKPGAELRSG